MELRTNILNIYLIQILENFENEKQRLLAQIRNSEEVAAAAKVEAAEAKQNAAEELANVKGKSAQLDKDRAIMAEANDRVTQ